MRKDDPVFYKVEIEKLISQAKENGLKISLADNGYEYKVVFESDNGERCGAVLIDFKKERMDESN